MASSKTLLAEPTDSASDEDKDRKIKVYIQDPEKLAGFLDDRIGSSYLSTYDKNCLIFVEDKEADDDMHMPYADDDTRLKPKRSDYMRRDQVVSFAGLAILVTGLLCVFIVIPVLTFSGTIQRDTTPANATITHGPGWVNDVVHPLLKNIRNGLIDPDTPASAMTRTAVDGSKLNLVFSDEFEKNNRTFYQGDDPFWLAQDLWYGATQDLEWYDPDAITTYNGALVIQMDEFENHNLQYRSGMLNSWNQNCFKGGALEVSISLPGPAGIPGLWPGAWTMGNLGRPGHMATTEGVWPYTYDRCDVGITPNQSDPSGISGLKGQKLASCVCNGEDHPTPGTGRGAPEIDIIEAGADPAKSIGIVTQSYQMAPYDIFYRPNYDFLEIPNPEFTSLNSYCGSALQQAMSGTTYLNNSWYDSQLYQKYGFEYTPGNDSEASIAWFVGDDVTYRMTADSIGQNGNIGQRVVSQEPMAIILNLGISNSWTAIDFGGLKFPTAMYVDYVRWYQKEGEESITCDPPGYETTAYINDHPIAYKNPNMTVCCLSLEDRHQRILFTNVNYRLGTQLAIPGRNTFSTPTANPSRRATYNRGCTSTLSH